MRLITCASRETVQEGTITTRVVLSADLHMDECPLRCMHDIGMRKTCKAIDVNASQYNHQTISNIEPMRKPHPGHT